MYPFDTASRVKSRSSAAGIDRTVTDDTDDGALAQVYRPSSPHGILRPDTSTISIFSITWYAPASVDWSRERDDVISRRCASAIRTMLLESRLSLARRSLFFAFRNTIPVAVCFLPRTSINSFYSCGPRELKINAIGTVRRARHYVNA